MPQMLNRILDRELTGLLGCLTLLQVLLVPGVLLLNRRGPAVGVAAGRRPANGQGCPAEGDLVGPAGEPEPPIFPGVFN